jgi:ketosteroid isomerase-like protein
MATEAHLPTTPAAITAQRAPIGPAASSALIRLALDYSDALDRCTQTAGANIDELMDLFAEGATWTVVGVTSLVGKAAIREMFLGRTARYQQVVETRGIELCGDLVICHGERRDTTFVQAGGEQQMRILLVKGGKIEQVIVVFDPEAFAKMRGGATAAAQALDAIGARDDRE